MLSGTQAVATRSEKIIQTPASLVVGSRVHITRYTSCDSIPDHVWDQLSPTETIGLQLSHLRALEVSRINDLHPYYLVGRVGDRPIGIAYCFAIDMDLTKLGSSEPASVLAAVKTWNPSFMQLRLVEVGYLSSLGTSVAVAPDYEKEFLAAMGEEVDNIARLEDADLAFIRDVSPQRYESFHILEDQGYRSVLGFPVARMRLRWKTFEEYLAALKGDKRSNIRRKQAKLHAPGMSVEIIDDYGPHAARLYELWHNVAVRKSDYEHERLSPEWFASMACHLKGRSHVIAIRRDRDIVAFALCMVGGDEYFWAYVGMEYDLRDTYELYFNLVFEGIRTAIAYGKKTLNLGITTYDFKTFVGAELEPCIYMVKSCKSTQLSGAYAEMFRTGIKQPENTHCVFKDQGSAAHVQPKAAEAVLRGFDNPRDPFVKHARYARSDVLKAAGVYAFFPSFEGAQEPVINCDGRQIIMLGTNSYLGLGTHPKVKAAAIAAIERYGTGCSGSPLLNGTLDLHEKLAQALARFMRKDDALVFSTGYQTNVGTVSTLVGERDVLVMDERNHASLIDGARLSRATVARYRHADLQSMEDALRQHADKPKLIVTDSLFSMEGTIIDLPGVVSLARKYEARIMLDESHALGVIGPTGRGVAEHYGLLDQVDIIMGTFSKSFASVGGFVVGQRKVIDTLKHTARSHVFSASLPPASAATVLAALEIVDSEPARRTKVLNNASYLASQLAALGYQVSYHGSAIVPVLCGSELLTVAVFHQLFEQGVFVNPVIYPAVPQGGELLRLSLMATFDIDILQRAVDVFRRVRAPQWPRSNRGGD